MTTRIEGSGSAPIVSELDTYQELIAKMELDNERTSRESMRADRDHARALGEDAAAEMREAADLRLASGVVSAGLKIANAVSSAAGTATSAARSNGELKLGDGSAADGAEAGATGATRRADYGDYAGATNDALEGIGSAVTSALDRAADEADIRAERARTAAEEARSRSEEARADADGAARVRDGFTEAYAQALTEKRRAEEAATRA